MNWFPKRSLGKLRQQAIDAADIVVKCENSWGARNIEKQYDTVASLRRAVEGMANSIGPDRVKFILNHNVPPIRSLFDLTSPRGGERGDLVPKQFTEAILTNIDFEIDKIERRRDRTSTLLWRIVGIPGIILAILGAAGAIIKWWPSLKALLPGR